LDAELRFESERDVVELSFEGFLIEDFKEVCDVVALVHEVFAGGFEAKENVAGKKRFGEDNGFAAIFVGGFVAGESGGDLLAIAIFDQLFLTARFCMRHEPR
jgi:hypothetical protein